MTRRLGLSTRAIHGDAAHASGLDARRTAASTKAPPSPIRSAPPPKCSTRGTATTPIRSRSPSVSRCSKAPRRRCSWRAAWAPPRSPISPCCGPATTCSSSEWIYGGTHRLFTEEFGRLGIEVTFVDPDAIARVEEGVPQEDPRGFRRNADQSVDARARHRALRAALQGRRAWRSWSTRPSPRPMNFRPLEHGADVVIHSATKYLNGHCDVIAGAVVGSRIVGGGGAPADAGVGTGARPHGRVARSIAG